MKIYVTSICPIDSAELLDDETLVESIDSTAKVLSNAVYFYGGSNPLLVEDGDTEWSIWTRMSDQNYMWMLWHLEALLSEYHQRNREHHKYDSLIQGFYDNVYIIPSGDFVEFEDSIKLNKTYLRNKWKTATQKPTWGRTSGKFS
jgi:hypothetical protein